MGLPDLAHLEEVLQPPPKIISAQQHLLLLGLEDPEDLEVPNRFAQIVGLQGGLGGPMEELQPQHRKLHFPQPSPAPLNLSVLVGHGD